jgi:hypothetical protein
MRKDGVARGLGGLGDEAVVEVDQGAVRAGEEVAWVRVGVLSFLGVLGGFGGFFRGAR